jgi:hypothetical protein
MMKMNFTVANKPIHKPTIHIIQTPTLAVSSIVTNRVVFGSLFDAIKPTGPCTSCGYGK